jgi:hypothetical protein
VPQLGHFGNKIRNTYKVLKCGAEERLRGSVGPIVLLMKKYYRESRRRGIFCMQ